MAMRGRLSVTDVRGKTFELSYGTTNGCSWGPCPSDTYLQSSLSVTCVITDGMRRGHGVQQIGLSRAYLTRHRDAIRTRY
jgi:hypothetical protein